MTAISAERCVILRRSDLASSDQGEPWRSGTLQNTLIPPFWIPEHLRVPSSKWDPNLYFLNMIAHSYTIRAHQQVLAKIGIESLHPDALMDTERVQLESAIEIAAIMRASCHVDLSAVSPSSFPAYSDTNVDKINPFTSFCLYVAATALARTKTIQLDENQKNSLQFLLTAMNYLEEVNPLTTAFIRDLESEFPDLTASFSGLNVSSCSENVRMVFPRVEISDALFTGPIISGINEGFARQVLL